MVTPLKNARKHRGLTTYEVARAVSVDQSHYSRVENGHSSASPELAEKLVGYFGGELTELQILYPERYPIPEGEAA